MQRPSGSWLARPVAPSGDCWGARLPRSTERRKAAGPRRAAAQRQGRPLLLPGAAPAPPAATSQLHQQAACWRGNSSWEERQSPACRLAGTSRHLQHTGQREWIGPALRRGSWKGSSALLSRSESKAGAAGDGLNLRFPPHAKRLVITFSEVIMITPGVAACCTMAREWRQAPAGGGGGAAPAWRRWPQPLEAKGAVLGRCRHCHLVSPLRSLAGWPCPRAKGLLGLGSWARGDRGCGTAQAPPRPAAPAAGGAPLPLRLCAA